MADILLVEDDFSLRLSLTSLLEGAGQRVTAVASAEEGRTSFEKNRPNLVILDWNLPGSPGIELLQHWRSQGAATPVIMLTARSGVEDRVKGLKTGADDYLVKPFSPDELLARVEVQLRRSEQSGQSSPPSFRIGDWLVNIARHELSKEGRVVSLTEQEAQTLAHLHSHRNEIVSRADLLRHVWGYRNTSLRTRAVDNAIYRLRAKIESDPLNPKHLISVHGTGYRLADEAT
ncbi:MAG: response regulator transcription factor [Planctomycetota bacterium]